MNKLLRTTYRKVYKLSSTVDKSMALRAMLVCAPLTAFDHHTDAWVPLNWPGMIATPESDLMLDCLIRQLNNGRQYYVPRGEEEEDMVTTTSGGAYAAHNMDSFATEPISYNTNNQDDLRDVTGRMTENPSSDGDVVNSRLHSRSGHSAQDSNSNDSSSSKDGGAADVSHVRDNSAQDAHGPAATKGSVSDSDGSSKSNAATSQLATTTSLLVCTGVRPYSSLSRTAHSLFASMSFSINNLNIAFAAIKLLHQLCLNNNTRDGSYDTSKNYDTYDALLQTPLCVPRSLHTLPVPQLTRVLQPTRFEGFALLRSHAEVLRNLSHTDARDEKAKDKSPGELEGMSVCDANATETAARKDKTKMIWVERRSAVGTDDADADMLSTSRAALTSRTAVQDGAGRCEDGGDDAPVEVASSPTPAVAVPTHESCVTQAAQSNTTSARDDKVRGQFLLAHPMLTGFFARTVQLLVRHSDDDAAALVLNKPLLNDKGVCMSVGATIHLNRVHPIFRTFLSSHPVMIAGPVMRGGSFDDSLFLLHRIPNIPYATLVGPSLWLDGDLDVLYARLASTTVAEVERSVVVLCGMACWSRNQLAGEVDGGTWVVAAAVDGAQDGMSVADYVMALVQSAAVVPPPSSTTSAKRTQDEDEEQEGNSTTGGGTTDSVKDGLASTQSSVTEDAAAAVACKNEEQHVGAKDEAARATELMDITDDAKKTSSSHARAVDATTQSKDDAEKESKIRRTAERNARAALAAASPRVASERAARRAAQVWMWSYDILGEPYAELSRCASSLDDGVE